MRKHSIGIIANPQSGRDIRRLVAHASVFDNEEKVNIVERLLATWNTMGLSSVLFMPDSYNIVYRAAERIRNLRVNLKQLDMKPLFCRQRYINGGFTNARKRGRHRGNRRRWNKQSSDQRA